MARVSTLATLAWCAHNTLGVESTLTQAQKTVILNKHNALRSNVASASTSPCTAADMEKLTWDDTLASTSQAYAEQCLYGVHENPMQPSGAGENLAMMAGDITDTNLEAWTARWYGEIVDVVWSADRRAVTAAKRSNPNDCAEVKNGGECVIGHATQVVWAATNKVGCGVAKCNTAGFANNGVNFVCKYLPGGNFVTDTDMYAPWIVGSPCAACGGANGGSCENNLCTNPSTVVRCQDDRLLRFNGVDYTECTKMFTAAASVYQNLCSGSFGGSQSTCEHSVAASQGCQWTNGACGVSAEKGKEVGCASATGFPEGCKKSCGSCTVPAGVGTCDAFVGPGGTQNAGVSTTLGTGTADGAPLPAKLSVGAATVATFTFSLFMLPF